MSSSVAFTKSRSKPSERRADDLAAAEVEARRVLHICNICGYCNGFCDTFAAARRHPALSLAEVRYLAHLCHACRNCLYACQYAPPHAFAVNVPRALAQARHASYVEHAWPRTLSFAFAYPWATALTVTALAVASLVGTVLLRAPVPFVADGEPGAFYRIVPWSWMMALGLLPLAWATLACGIGWRRFGRAIGAGRHGGWRATAAALRDLVRLRNLRGGGLGCNDRDARFSAWRRRAHQGVLVGVVLCGG